MRCVLVVLALVAMGTAMGPAWAQEETTTTLPEPTTTTTLLETTTTLEITTTTTSLPDVPTTSSTTTSTSSTVRLGECVPGGPAQCDDRNPCTADGCDAASLGCVHVPLSDTPCADDGVFCTADRCVNGACQHVPFDLLCDRGECVLRTCRSGELGADRRGCVLVESKLNEGDPCTDDGFSCTDDVCTFVGCLHVPIDGRCVPSNACTAAVCAPERPDRDAAGCAPGPARAEGEPCAEDGDVCTADLCRAGTCAHDAEIAPVDCAVVQDAFRQATAIGSLSRELATRIAGSGLPRLDAAAERLTQVGADLDAAALVLAGKAAVTPAMVSAAATTTAGISAQDRAHIAFTLVLHTPSQVGSFLQAVAQARARAALGRPLARQLRHRGRLLLRGTRLLKAELRALQR